MTNWFCSYLSSRFKVVESGGNASGLTPMVFGIPEGSVLGPLLFLIFIDDIQCFITIAIKLFADDCVLYNKIVTERDQILLNDNLLKIKQWGNEWQMVLNPRKSVFMLIT
ncbi:MAG: reverse transcriptase domain-containing protein, partial [Candidatus Midichloria sp.]|nr:reverse transcriptase domain-containing protein [Candidatus Midichloria sp.]